MKERLVILGAGGHGKVAADIAAFHYKEILFLDDAAATERCLGFPIVGTCAEAERFLPHAEFFVAVGNPRSRQRISEALEQSGASFATLIHPAAVVGRGVEIGAGSVIMAGAVLNAESRLGKSGIINTCASIDHDCVLGDYVHIAVGAHLAGAVSVGERSWIGAGAIVSNNLSITGDCVIGAGAVVIKNIAEHGTYAGVPARRLS